MLQAEKYDFINKEIKQIWPQWLWTDATTRIWYGVLTDFTYEEARLGIEKIFREDLIKWQRQLVPVFIKTTRRLRVGIKSEPALAYRLRCIEHDNKDGDEINFFWAGKGEVPPDETFEAESEIRRNEVQETYGGKWIVVRDWINIGKVEERLDDGLRGKAAKKEAERIILAGPDTPGRRFLLRQGRKVGEEESGPVLLGDVLEEVPF